ncbi:MAG TPA: protein-methionine-sulfoxide reductase heme-binding subunit MsrQ [Steroidobacteraceae bacterium]
MKPAKPALFVACALPLVWLVARTFGIVGHGLGANPISELIHQLGLWGLRLLLVTLCVSPLAVTLRKPKLMLLRRMLGLWSFTYLALHFLTWLVLDQSLRPAAIVADIVKRPYITVGFFALLMLIALAVTSTRKWMQRLGRRWHKLHQLIYPAAILGCWHFWWQVKADWREPLVYSVALAGLLAWRWRRFQARRPAPSPRPAPLTKAGSEA